MSAIIPAAIGADAEVPVCSFVHIPRRSVVTILGDVNPPDEYVVVIVEAQDSEYQGTSSFIVVALTDIV